MHTVSFYKFLLSWNHCSYRDIFFYLYQFADIHPLTSLHRIHIVKNSLDSSYIVLELAGLYYEKTNVLDTCSPVWECSLLWRRNYCPWKAANFRPMLGNYVNKKEFYMFFVSLLERKFHIGFSFLIACLCRLSVSPSFLPSVCVSIGSFVSPSFCTLFTSFRTTWTNLIKFCKRLFWVKRFKFIQMKGHVFFPNGVNNEIGKIRSQTF